MMLTPGLAWHQPGAYQRVGVVAARPHAEPAQAMAAGGVELAPTDTPAVGGAHRGGGRQTATGRGAQVGFDTQGIDQRAVLHRLLRDLHAQVCGPTLAVLQACVLQVLHHQDQCRGRFALGDGADDLARLDQAGATAAKFLRHGQGEEVVV